MASRSAAREEGHRDRVVEEHVLHHVDYVFSPFWSSACNEVARSEVRPSSSPPDVPRDVWGDPIGELPGASPGSPLPRIGCYHHNGYYFDGNGQPVDPEQYPVDWRLSKVAIGPRIGFGVYGLEVRDVFVQETPGADRSSGGQIDGLDDKQNDNWVVTETP